MLMKKLLGYDVFLDKRNIAKVFPIFKKDDPYVFENSSCYFKDIRETNLYTIIFIFQR